MSINLNRRDFLKVVFATTSAAAVAGAAPLWPKNAIARPISEPFKLAVDEFGYLVDPDFDYGHIELPTHREHLSLKGMNPKTLKKALDEQFGAIEHLVEDPNDWSLDEVEVWLDTEIEFEDLGPWQASSYGPYGSGMDIFHELSEKEAKRLGLFLFEDGTPGSSCFFVSFDGDIEELNSQFEALGMNVVVVQ
jgi:hypothetical protein